MRSVFLLGTAVALLPMALQAATPSKPTSRGVTEPPVGRGASDTSLGGAPIPGLCMLSQTAVLTNAKIALAADARLKQLTQQVETELQAEQTAISSDAKALEAERSGPDFQSRQAALQARAMALQQKSVLRQRELEATKQKVLARISSEAQPIVAQSFRTHDCGLLIDRSTVLLGNMSNDITAEVTRGLDAKISTITFERERLAK